MAGARSLDQLRRAIAEKDREILSHLAARMTLVEAVADVKSDTEQAVVQPGQMRAVLERAELIAAEVGIAPSFARELFEMIIEEACRVEDLRISELGDTLDHRSREKAVVFGGRGTAGTIVSGWLRAAGVAVTPVDLDPLEGEIGDVTRPSDKVLALVQRSRIVVLATPHRATIEGAQALYGFIRDDAVLVDLLSAKSAYAEAIAVLKPTCSVVGLNPMFGRDVRSQRPSVLTVTNQQGSGSSLLFELLGNIGLELVHLRTASQHDRLCARWQALPHATILAFGLAAQRLGGEDWQVDDELAPPPYRMMATLLARMVAGSPETYAEIQSTGQYAEASRSVLQSTIDELANTGQAGWADAVRTVGASCNERVTASGDRRFVQMVRAMHRGDVE